MMKADDIAEYSADIDNVTIRQGNDIISVPYDSIKEIVREIEVYKIIDEHFESIEDNLMKYNIDTTDEAIFHVAAEIYDLDYEADMDDEHLESMIDNFNYEELSDYIEDEKLFDKLRKEADVERE